MPVYSVHVYAPTVNPFWSNTGESAMYNVSGTSTVGSFNVVDILDDDAFINDTDPGAQNGSFVDNSQQVIDGTSTPIQGFFSIEIYNDTTGEFGRAFLLTTGSASPQSVSDGLGWVFTTPVSPGDTIDWLPTVNSRNPPHDEDFSWGEVAYADVVPPPNNDYTVEGTSGDDVIDGNYTGDPEGDLVDNNDHSDGSNDDLIEAYGGNDSVEAGLGDDTIFGGTGNDDIDAGDGNDTIFAGADNDTVVGGNDDDSISGGEGDDVLYGDQHPVGITNGSFEGPSPTGPSQVNILADWYDWNTGSPDLNEDGGYEVPWLNEDATDGSNYISFGRIGSSREGVSQDLSTPLSSGTTATITFDAASFAWNGSSYGSATSVELTIWGNPNSGETGANSTDAPSNAVLLGTVTIDTTTMQTYTIDVTPGFDVETISFSVGTEPFSYMITMDDVSMDVTGGGTVGGNDSIDGGIGDDDLFGGGGNDTLDGGANDDTLTGGEGDDVFVWDGNSSDVITDFGVGSTNPNDGDSTNNDFINLSGIFNPSTVAAYNLANGTNFSHAIDALNHDLADGVVNFNGTDMSGPTLTMNGVTGGLNFEQTGVTCFARGTHILTPGGDVLVENLRVGSRVETLDHGPQTVRWVGSTVRAATGACAPVRIRAGALENDRDLWVSQQHRMVLRGAKAELMFGEHEVFVPAKSLVNDCSVRIIEGGAVEYFHILFDTHEIIFAEGAMAESLHLGKQSFDALSYASRQEIKMLFPELDWTGTQLPQTARQVLRNYEVQALLHAV